MLVTGNPDGARSGYQDAASAFTELYNSVSAKRAAAQQAMDDAKKAVDNSAAYASEADGKVPLGNEKVEGIEEEDSVLLTPDTYGNPEDSVIDVNGTADGKAASEIESAAGGQGEADSAGKEADTEPGAVTGGAE
jgi:hypothetical protein